MRCQFFAATLLLSLFLVQSSGAKEPSAQPADSTAAEETNPAFLVNRAVESYQRKDYAKMAELLEQAVTIRPFLADVRFMLARAYSLMDDKEKAYDSLVQLQAQGLSYQMEGDSDFDNIRGYGLYDYLQGKFSEAAAPYGAVSTRFTLPAKPQLLESIAIDPDSDRLFIGSIESGTVYVASDDGTLKQFNEPVPTMLGVTALAIDSERSVLWAATAGSQHVAGIQDVDVGKTIVHRFDLETGKHQAAFSSPFKPSYVTDLVVAPDGAVYLAESVRPAVWMISAEAAASEGGQLELMFAGRTLTGIRALAVDDQNQFLYVADYQMGLVGMSLENREPIQIHLGKNLNLAGIDAMAWFDDSLVIVQNGLKPQRVLRLQMFDDHIRARHVQSMASGLPSFNAPSTVVIDGRQAVMIAASDRAAFDPRTGKRLADAGAPLEAPVVSIDLDFGWQPPEPGSFAQEAASADSEDSE